MSPTFDRKMARVALVREAVKEYPTTIEKIADSLSDEELGRMIDEEEKCRRQTKTV